MLLSNGHTADTRFYKGNLKATKVFIWLEITHYLFCNEQYMIFYGYGHSQKRCLERKKGSQWLWDMKKRALHASTEQISLYKKRCTSCTISKWTGSLDIQWCAKIITSRKGNPSTSALHRRMSRFFEKFLEGWGLSIYTWCNHDICESTGYEPENDQSLQGESSVNESINHITLLATRSSQRSRNCAYYEDLRTHYPIQRCQDPRRRFCWTSGR